MASTITLYADNTSGILFADTASNRTQVIFTYTTAGSITSFTPKSYPRPLEIPSTLGGVTVTSIGEAVFQNCTSLKSITIPALVTSIGNNAFRNCTLLTSLTFASGSQLLTIGNHAFQSSGLTSFVIPASVTSVGNDAFTYCSLTSINILASITSFSQSTFYGSKLTSITIPASVTTIGEQVFENCDALETVTFASVSQLLTIGNNAFTNCSKLTAIVIPASVTSINNRAFNSCSSLTSINIPNKVTIIGQDAFESCTKLTSISVDPNNENYSSLDGVLYDKLIRTLIRYPSGKVGSTTIPASVTSIGEAAFRDCIKLTSISVDPNNQNYSSADGVLYDKLIRTLICYPSGKSGSTFTILNTVTSIGREAFKSCSGLTSITIPDSVTSIGEIAFQNCSSLKSITIPASVTSIGGGAFFSCNKLETVNVSPGFLSSNNLTAGSNKPFYGRSSGVTIIVYKLFKSTGELTGATAQLNGATLAIIEGYSSIGANAFLNAASLTSIIIPASVTTIGLSAFINCTGLTSMTFASGSQLLTIGGNAFNGCTKLTSITIPASVTDIGLNAFTNSGLITMYVSTRNKLGLTPSTPMPLYGKTFTIIGNAPTAPPTIPICFLAGTKVTTDQGDIAVEKLNPKLHTILGKKFVSITKSAPLKKIFYKGKGVNAIDLVEGYQGAPENNSELLHIVRIKK